MRKSAVGIKLLGKESWQNRSRVFYALRLLRFQRPDMARPDRVFGSPVLPGLYLLLALFLEVQLLRYKPQYTWPGLVIILSGVPVYGLWQKSQSVRLRRNQIGRA